MRALRVVLVGVWVVGGALTVLHALDASGLSLVSPQSAPVLETAAACGATLLAALSYGRWRQRRLVNDLIICGAFGLLAAGNLLFSLLPMVAAPDTGVGAVRAAAFVTGVASAIVFLVGSIVPERTTSDRLGRADGLLLALIVMLVTAASAFAAAHSGSFFAGLTGPPSTEVVGTSGGLSVATIQLIAAAAFALGSLRFFRRAARDHDSFHGWLAVAAALWALARTNFAFTPSQQLAEHVTIGDWLRIAAYVVAVIAAAAELTSYWHRLAETAVLEERRRIARDLHDGLAQELAFITTQTRGLAADPDRLSMVSRSAERALDESRRAIAALTRPVDEPLDVALAQQAEEIGGRLGIRVLLEVEPVGPVTSETKEALLRIAREAMINAGRHGRPSRINVGLADHDGITLKIADDGRGFRPDDRAIFAGDRCGVAGMRERAESLGGRFVLQSRPFGGTKVEVWLP